MPSSAQRRKRAATRARTTLPPRRPTANQRFARRGLVVLGIVIAASLVIALVGTFSASNTGTPVPTTPSQTDPNQLIARATANPDDGDTVGALADYFGMTGQYQRAVVLYQRYLQLRPDDARAHVTLGDVYTALQPPQLTNALSEYRLASQLDPSGDAGNNARTRLNSLQQQLGIGAATVVAPTVGPTGTP